ncbi:cyclic nucleotide-binding domain protein, putative (macronuclear) [Tetrahymena thermophila SB210]|uniref:Cyclic nucleotide-binding domain protein, putative n=1 Tax=Tetrahymena thermophila (strain SB210) TaxID=312017 RepID=I7MCD2_TETTS|nr:cyclic nucleotide-binding domain protein, putative [Tetrahymena thermophila SB210]EAR83305.2 cyclic nucleotide-binding domain protein, putative [Tetrahymena thermophila SB210]|eukprot:XP_001030968.2 cyclic nucleotide-binding domain protein, putative [Tetrahymena thermophila SB210]
MYLTLQYVLIYLFIHGKLFGYIVRKKVKLEKDIKFMIKFLDYFKFFKELRMNISLDLYVDTLKKMQFEIVEQNQFICSKSKLKKKNKQQNNFYIVIEGEVMEFQQLNFEQDSSNASNKCQEMQNNVQLKQDFQNSSESQLLLEKNNSYNALNTSQESLYDQKSNKSSRKSSRMNSPSNIVVQNSVNRLSQLDQSIKQAFSQFSPKAHKKKDSIAFLDQNLIEEEMAFIRNINLCLENFKSIGKINQNSKKFLKVVEKAISLLKVKNSLLLRPSQLSSFSVSRQDSRNTPQIISKMASQQESKYDVLDDASPYSPQTTNQRNFNQDREFQMILQIASHFKDMKLRKLLKQGEIFGEFDDGNLNLLEQGYMSKKKTCLVYLSYSVYNEIIQKHQIQSVENKIKFLQQFIFFKSYSKQKMKNYLKYFQSATYYRNNILYSELDPSSFIYFIISGEIEFSRLFKLENQNQNNNNEKMIPLNKLNAQDFDLTFNPFEKQEREIYKLNQGKQNKERSQLIKRINSFILGPNQYFGEKEVLTNSFRISQAKVLSVKLEVIQLPSYIYYEQFYDQDIHEACLQESHLKEIEEINIYNQVQSRQPYQNIVEKLENDYLKDFVKNNQKDVTKKIDLLMSNLPPQLPIELLKKGIQITLIHKF